jgi:hypothetical protein
MNVLRLNNAKDVPQSGHLEKKAVSSYDKNYGNRYKIYSRYYVCDVLIPSRQMTRKLKKERIVIRGSRSNEVYGKNFIPLYNLNFFR